MFWTEDADSKQEYKVPDDIVDVSFVINCKALPLEHAHALNQALYTALPWLAAEEQAGIHLIHGADSGNGWQRPENPEDLLHLSRRARMMLRMPKERLDDVLLLTGQKLDIAGHTLEVGEGTIKQFSTLPTMFARYVATTKELDEDAFLQESARELQKLGIRIRKMMAGLQGVLRLPEGPLYTRSLMLADLEPEEAVTLQQVGIGPHRKYGCGLFIPQKGISAVKSD